MGLPRVVRVLASVRVPSSYGPEVQYELVHAVLRSESDSRATFEAVILRLGGTEGMYRGGPLEILAQDLPAVHAEWSRFVADVLARRAEAGDPEARGALEKLRRPEAPPTSQSLGGAPVVISASGGRFGARGRLSGSPPPELPPVLAAGPKRGSAPPAAPGPAPLAQAEFSPPPAAEEPDLTQLPDQVQVIGFHLSTPPTAEGLISHLATRPQELVVLAPATIAPRVEAYLRDVRAGASPGPPQGFSRIVVRRTANFSFKRLRAELATAIARMLGEVHSSVWILPEPPNPAR